VKALMYMGPRRIEIQEIDRPSCGPDEALIKVEAVGICGSDLGGYLGHHARRQAGLVLGHELAGTVVELGANAAGAEIGDRVCVNPLFSCGVCENCRGGRPNLCAQWRLLGMDRVQGAMAEYVCAPVSALRPLSDGTGPVRGACVEPLACAVHILSLAPAAPFSSLLIIGAGTQGALIALLARQLGYGTIVNVDVNPRRLEAVTELAGIDAAINPRESDLDSAIRGIFGPAGADIAIDAVGSTVARDQAMRYCRSGGDVLFMGLAEQRSDLDVITMIRKEQRLIGSFAYADRDFSAAQRLIETGAADFSRWTETLGLEQGPEAFHRLTTDPGATLKIVLQP